MSVSYRLVQGCANTPAGRFWPAVEAKSTSVTGGPVSHDPGPHDRESRSIAVVLPSGQRRRKAQGGGGGIARASPPRGRLLGRLIDREALARAVPAPHPHHMLAGRRALYLPDFPAQRPVRGLASLQDLAIPARRRGDGGRLGRLVTALEQH